MRSRSRICTAIIGGIPYLLPRQHVAGRTRPLTIAGPRALAARVVSAEQARHPDLFGRKPVAFALHVGDRLVAYSGDAVWTGEHARWR